MSSLSELEACLPRLPRRLLVGLSGGADSVALLRLLLLRRDRGEAELTCVHVNHHLRGEEADADERFAAELCAAWQVPLTVLHAVPPEHPGEGWARSARYGLFREALQESGAEALALAHHRGDQAETVLLHLLRGAGLRGLCGIRPDTLVDGMRIVRPLLDLPGGALRDALREAGQPWREDATNRELYYLRNRVRWELLPLMEKLAPGVEARLAATAALLREDDQTLDALTEAFLNRFGKENYLPRVELARLPKGLQARALRTWWAAQVRRGKERSLSAEQTEALLALCAAKTGDRLSLPGGTAYLGWRCVHCLTGEETAPAPVPFDGGPAVMNGITLVAERGAAGWGDGLLSQAVPSELPAGLTVRTWRQGDWIRPFGSAGKKSLQDYFTDKKVDMPFRRRIPLLCRGSEVLLVCGLGAGGLPALSDLGGASTLRWIAEKPLPWMAA